MGKRKEAGAAEDLQGREETTSAPVDEGEQLEGGIVDESGDPAPPLPPAIVRPRPTPQQIAELAAELTPDEYKLLCDIRAGLVSPSEVSPAVELGEHTHWLARAHIVCMVRNRHGDMTRGEIPAGEMVPADDLDEATWRDLLRRELIVPARPADEV